MIYEIGLTSHSLLHGRLVQHPHVPAGTSVLMVISISSVLPLLSFYGASHLEGVCIFPRDSPQPSLIPTFISNKVKVNVMF